MADNPTGDKTSLIRPYSLGLAAANLVFGQKELEVVPIEDLAHLDGEISDLQVNMSSTGVDTKGNTYATKQTVSNSIKATWLPLDSHRPFPSLIRRGEKVMIWRVGDTDKYYWTDMGLDNTTRRRDIMTFLVPNSPKEGEDSYTPDTAYFIEVNTVDKHITIQTNKNDGEQFAYLLQLNPGGSNASLCDDAGNFFQLDSKAKRISFKNQMESECWIEKTKGGMTTKDEIILDTKKITFKASESITSTTKVISTTATESITETTKTYSLKAPTSYTVTTGIASTTATGTAIIRAAGITLNSSAGLGLSATGAATCTGVSMAFNVTTLTHGGMNIGKDHFHWYAGTNPTSNVKG